MKYKRIMIIIMLVIFLFATATASASDVNGMAIATDDTNQIESSSSYEMSEDSLQTSEENAILTHTDNDEIIGMETDSAILNEGEGTYSDLRTDIENGGNLTKSHYSYCNGDGNTIEITTPSMVIDGNGAIIDMAGSNIRAFKVSASGVTIKNLTIKNANCNSMGGAIYFNCDYGEVTDCNFIKNKATGSSNDGGAIYFKKGTVTNCNFIDNEASDDGGAIFLDGDVNVTNCNFTNNTALNSGGALHCDGNKYVAVVTNCIFINNTARVGGATWFDCKGIVTNCIFINNNGTIYYGAILSTDFGLVTADTCIFKTDSDTTVYTHILPPTLDTDNLMIYKSGEKLTFDLKTYRGMTVDNGNISIKVYHMYNNSLAGEYSCLSGEGWAVDLPAGFYNVVFNTEYEKSNTVTKTIKVIPNIKYHVDITPITTASKKVKITAKSNLPNDILQGSLIFVFPDGDEIIAECNANGVWWAEYTFENYGRYSVNAYYTDFKGVTVNKAVIVVKKITPKLTAKNKSFKAKTKTKKYAIALKDNAGKPIKKTKVTLKVNGKTYKATTNSKGQATFKITKLTKKGTFKSKVTFSGNEYYNMATKTVKIKIK